MARNPLTLLAGESVDSNHNPCQHQRSDPTTLYEMRRTLSSICY
jgi:hypothetical protein